MNKIRFFALAFFTLFATSEVLAKRPHPKALPYLRKMHPTLQRCAAAAGQNCRYVILSDYRHKAITASGNRSCHGLGKALDLLLKCDGRDNIPFTDTRMWDFASCIRGRGHYACYANRKVGKVMGRCNIDHHINHIHVGECGSEKGPSKVSWLRGNRRFQYNRGLVASSRRLRQRYSTPPVTRRMTRRYPASYRPRSFRPARSSGWKAKIHSGIDEDGV